MSETGKAAVFQQAEWEGKQTATSRAVITP